MASNNSAKKMRKCRRIIVLSLFLIALVIAGLRAFDIHLFSDKSRGAHTDSNTRESSTVNATPLSESERDRLEVQGIPDSLIELAEKTPEAIPFVQDYVSHGQDTSKISLKKDLHSDRAIPLLIQWDERWGYRQYGGDFLAVTGCGPTCLSMVKTGLSGSGKWNPYKVAKKAEKEGYYVEGQGSSWDLMRTGAGLFGLISSEVVFDQSHIIRELQAGRPIICSMRPGDFTTTGHFLVLSGVAEDGKIQVNDPNSYERSNQLWDLDRLMPQIRNLWSFEEG